MHYWRTLTHGYCILQWWHFGLHGAISLNPPAFWVLPSEQSFGLLMTITYRQQWSPIQQYNGCFDWVTDSAVLSMFGLVLSVEFILGFHCCDRHCCWSWVERNCDSFKLVKAFIDIQIQLLHNWAITVCFCWRFMELYSTLIVTKLADLINHD